MVDFFHQALTNRPVTASERATYSEVARWIAVGALFVSLILSYAWSHREILNINYEMQNLKRENEELRENNTALRAEHSSLINPESIEEQARNIGLVASNQKEVTILDSDSLAQAKPSDNVVAQSTLPKNRLHE